MKSNEIKPGRAHEDIWCIGAIIFWIVIGLCIGMVLGAVYIAFCVLAQVFFHDQSLDAWVLLFIGWVVIIITILVIDEWLAYPGQRQGGTK